MQIVVKNPWLVDVKYGQTCWICPKNFRRKRVIVFLDKNSRYTRVFDDFYELLLKPCNLKDAWIENIMEGVISPKGESVMADDLGEKGEVVDKIWYRSGKKIKINAMTFKLLIAEFTDEEGNQLSDHYPISSDIFYKLN